MKSLQISTAAALAGLPGSLLAHAGLDQSSTVMVSLHNMAHAMSDHPLLTALLGAVVIGGLGLYLGRHDQRRSP